mmetsp:Transcript_23321/g.32807  ORF Transcript_23321/g.32807 Transcript_23321/m.32807 type:complete len:135 (-) Transcript_23321:261-665(-)
MMRLLTHNYLQSTVKGTEKGYPLIIEATKIEYEESPVDTEFMKSVLQKIQYTALLSATKQISPLCDTPLPEIPEDLDISSDHAVEMIDVMVLKNLHTILFDVHVLEGHLICPDTNRRFPISMGIPNMILHEDEI